MFFLNRDPMNPSVKQLRPCLYRAGRIRVRHNQVRILFLCLGLSLVISPAALPAVGPLEFDGETAVSIYRDFDDGLFGRSIYRGVVFSVKLDSFQRYESLPLLDNPVYRSEGLSAYLVGAERAEQLAAGLGTGVTRYVPLPDVSRRGKFVQPVQIVQPTEKGSPEDYLYRYDKGGIQLMFSLERASEALRDEIKRTYPENNDVAGQVLQSYEIGYVVRIHEAENVYRPEFLELDYEDILISASLIGDRFQPLWGIHDGNDICAPES